MLSLLVSYAYSGTSGDGVWWWSGLFLTMTVANQVALLMWSLLAWSRRNTKPDVLQVISRWNGSVLVGTLPALLVLALCNHGLMAGDQLDKAVCVYLSLVWLLYILRHDFSDSSTTSAGAGGENTSLAHILGHVILCAISCPQWAQRPAPCVLQLPVPVYSSIAPFTVCALCAITVAGVQLWPSKLSPAVKATVRPIVAAFFICFARVINYMCFPVAAVYSSCSCAYSAGLLRRGEQLAALVRQVLVSAGACRACTMIHSDKFPSKSVMLRSLSQLTGPLHATKPCSIATGRCVFRRSCCCRERTSCSVVQS